ncbi:hypothetical protein C7S18_00980 [Ahniella affigens]|uniref:Glutaredoxin domain-containing protein n=1 Tax=Ahniella affigens TaxID=2021234 RepID=A0A2P1PLZ1_9GAMM|nr:glutaredoxin [Ahniella affigens]AVP95856.1 hypothetical protein C7S18_00980 [Ahniella affigens]
MTQTLKGIFLFVLFVSVGLGAGYAARIGLAKASEPEPVVHGDFRTVLAPHQSDLVLFATKTCPYCAKAREFFQEHGLRYHELDVDDPAIAQQFKALGGSGVPMVFSADVRIVGFDANAYARLLPAAR